VIRHIVAFDLSSADPAERSTQIAHMREVLEPLIDLDVVESLTVRADLGRAAGHWPVVLVSEHRTVADLEAYQAHPDHVTAAAVAGQYVSGRAIVDYELP
jgi:hypothetical protein